MLSTPVTSSVVDPDAYWPSLFFTDPSINKQKKVRKTLISTILLLVFDFSSMKTDVKVPSKSKRQENFEKKKLIFC
jgi:hypothetical protein